MKVKKLDSFTLSEILISLTIMTIVILIVYFAYMALNRYFSSYQVRNKDLIEMNEALFLIKNDLNRATDILPLDSGVMFISRMDTIEYQIENKKLSRNQNIFDFRVLELQYDSTERQSVKLRVEVAKEAWEFSLSY